MTALALYYHPLSSGCHKVPLALDALGIELDLRLLNPGDAVERAAHLALWPIGKMPLLENEGQPIPETSTINEHLQTHHVRPGRTLIPSGPDAALNCCPWRRSAMRESVDTAIACKDMSRSHCVIERRVNVETSRPSSPS